MASLVSVNAPIVFELVDAFLTLEIMCWPCPAARATLSRPSFRKLAPATAVAEFLGAVELVCDTHRGLRFFWKDERVRFLGASAAFATDAGFRRPEELIGRTDTDEIFPWSRQGAKYIADDRRVMIDGIPKLDILERQDESGGATRWLRTSKVPVRKGDDVVATIGGFEIIDVERAKALMRGKPLV